jgi:hypothetical protein
MWAAVGDRQPPTQAGPELTPVHQTLELLSSERQEGVRIWSGACRQTAIQVERAEPDEQRRRQPVMRDGAERGAVSKQDGRVPWQTGKTSPPANPLDLVVPDHLAAPFHEVQLSKT